MIAIGNSGLPLGNTKNWLAVSIEISTLPFGFAAGFSVSLSKQSKPFPTNPLSHLHTLVFWSQEAPFPHFGIFSHVVGTPSHGMSVAFLQKFPHLSLALSPHCLFPGMHQAQSVLLGSE